MTKADTLASLEPLAVQLYSTHKAYHFTPYILG